MNYLDKVKIKRYLPFFLGFFISFSLISYNVFILDLVWEIDEFHGPNQGLILAEVELSSEDQAFQKPDWIGQEVSADPRYSNASLVDYPYRSWPENGNN